MTIYKPAGYNSLSPYLIADNAQKLVDLLKVIFSATELRRFDHGRYYCTHRTQIGRHNNYDQQ